MKAYAACLLRTTYDVGGRRDLKLLLACEFYHPSVGGVQEVMRQLAEHFVAHGHDVTVATTKLPDRNTSTINGVQIREFAISGNAVYGLRGDTEEYRRFVMASDYDVFMVKAAQQWTFDALFPILKRMTKPKMFVPCGFSALFEPRFATYYRKMPEYLAAFDRLIFYATQYRDIEFARAHGLVNLDVIPNGASEAEFSVTADGAFRDRMGLARDAFVVLTVGTFTGQKGHMEVALAFEQAFAGENAVLILNGNELVRLNRPRLVDRARVWAMWPRHQYRLLKLRLQRRQLPETADDLQVVVDRINASSDVTRAYVVNLPRRELVQAFLNADLFAFASNIEYSPLVLYEAAAAGLPFLSVPVGNAEEIAAWTGAGVICPAPQDALGYTRVEIAQFAAELAALAADPGRLRELGRVGRERWLEHFTWETISVQYERLFETAIASSRGCL